MVISNIIGVLSDPASQWVKIRNENCSVTDCILKHVALMALIPAVSGFIGTTKVGWEIGASGTHYLDADNALLIAIAIYFTMVIGVLGMGNMIRWMSRTYGDDKALSQCVALAAYVVTPLFLIGFMLLYPVLWLNMLIGMAAVAHTVYLLYIGLPIMMEVNQEKGFLFASAILGLGLVAMVAILAVTVLLWGFGFGPAHAAAIPLN